ncbi:MAG TPA: oxygenase MpaB family protein [Actinomadura sp.]|jgi:uncharacterized protein (DUF2236 family)|nr:oxygenase MpaB family protein [Actinomadura sp.]
MTRTQDIAPLGPDSLTWRFFGDTRMALVGVRAAVMQNLLPALGQGVYDHSVFFTETIARLRRSAGPILDVVYAGPRAHDTGLRIRDWHKDVKGVDEQGRRYHALDPGTFFWAHATFFDHMLYGTETFVGPLSERDKERLYEESLRWFRLYGVGGRSMPPDWEGFQAYWDRMLAEELEPHRTARYGVGFVTKGLPRPRRVPAPVWRAVHPPLHALARFLTVGGLPPRARELLGLGWSAADERRHRRFAAVVRRVWPLLPRRLRYVKAARRAFARDGAPRRPPAAPS